MYIIGTHESESYNVISNVNFPKRSAIYLQLHRLPTSTKYEYLEHRFLCQLITKRHSFKENKAFYTR